MFFSLAHLLRKSFLGEVTAEGSNPTPDVTLGWQSGRLRGELFLWEGSKQGGCGGLKIRRRRFDSFPSHLVIILIKNTDIMSGS